MDECEIEEKVQQLRDSIFNPKILIKEENLYSVVARTEQDAKHNKPYARLSKQKDNGGEFVITRTKRKVYREKWLYL